MAVWTRSAIAFVALLSIGAGLACAMLVAYRDIDSAEATLWGNIVLSRDNRTVLRLELRATDGGG